jgi:thymidylate synthase (FAD)
MIKSKHGAMLEHGTVYLLIPELNYFPDLEAFNTNPYMKVIYFNRNWYITTNLRVLVENDWLDYLGYICEPTEHHEKRITARFTCDRGVSHEIVRHRVMSFAQESQRYVGYDKEKFGSEVTFIKPHWYNEEFPTCLTWIESLKRSEKEYLDLREMGLKPQDARDVLPNATKTEVVVTGFESDWEHFFELRTAGAAHPDMRKLALELQEKLNSVNK